MHDCYTHYSKPRNSEDFNFFNEENYGEVIELFVYSGVLSGNKLKHKASCNVTLPLPKFIYHFLDK